MPPWMVIAALCSINLLAVAFTGPTYRDGGRPRMAAWANVMLNVLVVTGGSLGALVAGFVWSQRTGIRHVRARLHALFWLVVQGAAAWVVLGPDHEVYRSWCVELYARHTGLVAYLALINVVTFMAFALDKAKARLGRWRIRESVLLGLAAAAGSAGALLAMDLCNHKVRKARFVVGVPLMLAAHLALLTLVAEGRLL